MMKQQHPQIRTYLKSKTSICYQRRRQIYFKLLPQNVWIYEKNKDHTSNLQLQYCEAE